MMHVSCHAGGEAQSAHHDQLDWCQHLRGQQLHGILKGGDLAAAGSHLLRPNLHTDQRTAYSAYPANDPCLKTKGAQDAAHKRAGDAATSSIQGIPVGWCKTRGMYACMHGEHKLSEPKAARKYKTRVANVLPAAITMDGAGALDHLGAKGGPAGRMQLHACQLRAQALEALWAWGLQGPELGALARLQAHCAEHIRIRLCCPRTVPQAWQPCVSPDDM